MTVKHGKQRSSEVRQGCEGSQPEGEPRSMGAFSSTSTESRAYPLPVAREDRNEPNTVVTGERSTNGIPGKIIGQLIDETEKQLAYYEQQAEVLRDRLKDLKQIPESLTDVNHTE